jgi:uncharacterized membrane protein YdbT with pleckstrin-like domain
MDALHRVLCLGSLAQKSRTAEGPYSRKSPEEEPMRALRSIVVALIVVALVFLLIGLLVKALKWLLILGIVVLVIGIASGFMGRGRSRS